LKRIIIILLFITLLIYISCKGNTEPVLQPCSPYKGITETDATGTIFGNEDTEDWQSSGILTLYPAYPNPCDGTISISFSISEPAEVLITINDSPNKIINSFSLGNIPAGGHKILWNGTDDSGEMVPDCIYRAHISAIKNDVSFSSYGDVKVIQK